MKEVKSYKDLVVWQKSMDLVVQIYTLTEAFPSHERFGLTSQIRRCAVSIPSNIAEGSRRSSSGDYSRFVHMAYGSGAELETQLELAYRLRYISKEQLMPLTNLLTEIMKMLNRLLSVLS